KERQVLSIPPFHEWQALNERGVRPETLDGGGHRPAYVDERKQLRVRKSLAQNLERFLAASHPGEPIVYESNSHRCRSARRAAPGTQHPAAGTFTRALQCVRKYRGRVAPTLPRKTGS